ncbi:hypothetical protein E2562_016313 [Oryza meyeriana var. granulata]|uniref:Uncharacterized protein n=1 Tax=Oryza meyeriana var. granulata TaxID=110450 RepID=A0A6G1DX78_9ORYZ|nr:hypothetical protein E2562_016313 [Oryza meyeriana var. granulata]
MGAAITVSDHLTAERRRVSLEPAPPPIYVARSPCPSPISSLPKRPAISSTTTAASILHHDRSLASSADQNSASSPSRPPSQLPVDDLLPVVGDNGRIPRIRISDYPFKAMQAMIQNYCRLIRRGRSSVARSPHRRCLRRFLTIVSVAGAYACAADPLSPKRHLLLDYIASNPPTVAEWWVYWGSSYFWFDWTRQSAAVAGKEDR